MQSVQSNFVFKKGISSPVMQIKSKSPKAGTFFTSKVKDSRMKIHAKSEASVKSVKILPKLCSTFEEDLKKLEKLTFQNYSVRNTWLEIEEKLLQLNLKRKLEPITENKIARKGLSIDFYSPRQSITKDLGLL